MPLVAFCVVAIFASAGNLFIILFPYVSHKFQMATRTNIRLNVLTLRMFLYSKLGILDSFSRGMQAAAIHNMNRPQQKPLQPTEQTPINNLTNNPQQQTHTSSTFMPTLSGAQQRVGITKHSFLKII